MPSPATHTTLTKLIKMVLKKVDSYNSADLTIATDTVDQETAGEQARLCLNLSLQKMYGMIKNSRYLEAYPSTTLHQTEGQAWIDLDDEATLDDIVAITDTTNRIKLVRKSWSWYRSRLQNASDASGVPEAYVRRNNRVYIYPTAVDDRALTFDFTKFTGDMTLGNDTSLLPSTYDYWIVSEAAYEWFATEDPNAVPEIVVNGRNESREVAMASIFPDYDSSLQSGSCIDRYDERRGAWDRLR